MAVTPVQPFRKGIPGFYVSVELALGANWNDTAPTWTDVSSRVRFTPGTGISLSAGRDDEYSIVSPGQFTIDFNNLDGAFDPENAASPYYPNIEFDTPCRITCYYPTPSTSYVQMVGVVDQWEFTYQPGGDSVCRASGNEMMAMLARYRLNGFPFLSTTGITRCQEICSRVPWPTAWQSFIGMTGVLVAGTVLSSDALTELQKVTDGQIVVLYQNRNGILTDKSFFATAGGTNIGTGPAGSVAAIREFTKVRGGVGIYTMVEITAPGAGANGADYVATKVVNASWVTRYGQISLQKTISQASSTTAQGVASSYASSLATRSFTRPQSITIYPGRDPATLMPIVLAADQFTGITVKHRAPGTNKTMSIDATIRSRSLKITRDGFVVNWTCSQ